MMKEDKKNLLKKIFSSLIQAVVGTALTVIIIISIMNIYININCEYYQIHTDSCTYYVKEYEIVDKDTIKITYYGHDIEIKGNFTIVEPLKNKNTKEYA